MAKPKLPVDRKVDGAAGQGLRDVRDTLKGVLDQGHLFGVHVNVTFPGASSAVRVTTGLNGTVSGYRVEKSSADVRVFDASPPTGVASTPGVIWLQATAAATVKLYLFTD